MSRARRDAFPGILGLDTNRVGRPANTDIGQLPERETDVADAVGDELMSVHCAGLGRRLWAATSIRFSSGSQR